MLRNDRKCQYILFQKNDSTWQGFKHCSGCSSQTKDKIAWDLCNEWPIQSTWMGIQSIKYEVFGTNNNHGCPIWSVSYFNNIFLHNSNLIAISFCRNSVPGHPIATKLCTCHDSTAVVSFTQLCSNPFCRIWMRTKWNFLQIWIVMEKSLVKWALSSHCTHLTSCH